MNNEEIKIMQILVDPQPLVRLTEAADRLLAGLDDGTIDPAAVALADALDACVSALPDLPQPTTGVTRFASVLGLIHQASSSPVMVSRLLADACESVTAEGSQPKDDPAVKVLHQYLVWLLGWPEDDAYESALQHCLDRGMASS